MANTFKRLITGTRARILESRLTAAFEQAAKTVAGVNATLPPLEVIDLAVNELATHVQPAGRGRYSFPFNQVTITFVAPTREDEARFEAICAGPPAIDERIARRLASAGCEAPDVDVIVGFVAALPSRDVAIADRGVIDPSGEGSLTQNFANHKSREASPALARPEPRLFEISLARVPAATRAPRDPGLAIALTVTNGAAASSDYSFSSFPVAIGRGADVRDSRNQLLRINHVAFIESKDDTDTDVNRSVSRRHARIELDARTGRPRLVDDNSAQGTSIVRGTRGIAVPRGSRGLGLQSGDEIILGQARIKIKIGLPDPASADTTSRSGT